MQKKYKATIALCLSIAGLLLTYPYAGSGFLGGLVHGGFLAATIGGMADWFAVTALFGKPLGISYRTDILRRNRPRIMQEIVDYAGEDLLSVQNIMSVVREQNMAKMMADYLTMRGGKERLKATLDEVLLGIARSMDAQELARALNPAIQQSLKDFSLEKLLLRFLSMLSEEKYSREILATLLQIAQKVIASPVVQDALLANIRVLRQRYEEKSSARSMVFQMMDLTDERIREILNEKLQAYIENCMAQENASYAQLKEGFRSILQALGKSTELGEALSSWKERHILQMDFTQPIALWLEKNIQSDHPTWLEDVHRLVDGLIEKFARERTWQEKAESAVKRLIESELAEHHDFLKGMIEQRLAEFSDDQLVEFVETRIADDVQIIRINGSVVGALVGMFLYIVVFALESIW